MGINLSKVLKPVFKLSAEAFPTMAAERFGAQEDMDRTWLTFEPVARTLVDSFYMTIDNSRFDKLVPLLDAIEPELRGIAYEGAGMGLMLLDSLFPTKKRLAAFLAGPGAHYRCLVYIGAGLVLPRVPKNPERFTAQQDPLLGWFVIDGYGFYEGFFSWRTIVNEHAVPSRLTGYSLRAFDHGLGRSFWFSTGANVDRIIQTIDGFPASRRPDLWSGIGLACAYAAGVMDRAAIERLLAAAGQHRAHFAVGTAMASVFREESHHPAPHTELACDVVWDRDSLEVARIADRARQNLPESGPEPAYASWRRRIEALWLAQPDLPSTDEGKQP